MARPLGLNRFGVVLFKMMLDNGIVSLEQMSRLMAENGYEMSPEKLRKLMFAEPGDDARKVIEED